MRSGLFCQDVAINCSEGTLQGRMTFCDEHQGKPGVILCPPHPLLAGNMDNNVLVAITQKLAPAFGVVAFNYRSVGKSFKIDPELPLFEYWNRLDQENDFSAVINDVKDLIGWSSQFFSGLHLIGYSFGSYIALQALQEFTLSYTAIAPPFPEHDFSRIQSLSCPICCIFAEQDNLIGQQKNMLSETASIHEIQGSDHFFLKREEEVAEIIATFLISS